MPSKPTTKPRRDGISFSAARFAKTLSQVQDLTKKQAAADAERGRIRREYNEVFAAEFNAIARDLEQGATPYLINELVKMFKKFAILIVPPPTSVGQPIPVPKTPTNRRG